MRVFLLLAACRDPGPIESSAPPPLLDRGPVALDKTTWSSEELGGASLASEWPGNRGPGVAVADLDGDGWLDLFVALPVGPSVALRNERGALAVWPDASLNGGPLPTGLSAAAGDLDLDGDFDLVVGSAEGAPDLVLWNTGGGAFVGESLPNSDGETKSVHVVDVTGDGALDVLTSGFVVDPTFDKVLSGEQVGSGNHVYVRTPAGDWSDDRGRIPSAVEQALTYMYVPLDADRDGDVDLYQVNDYGPQLVRNALLVNDGQGWFSIAADCGCDLAIKGMGAAQGDPTGDGIPDLYVTDVKKVHLLVSAGPASWVEGAAFYGAEPDHPPSVSWGASFVDLDLDTYEELAVAYGIIEPEFPVDDTEDVLFQGLPDGQFDDISAATGFEDDGTGRVVAVGDLDRDGRPELITAGIPYLTVWWNVGAYDPGVTLRLAGPTAHGIGARVDVVAGERTYTRWMQPSTMYGTSAYELYLGHGDALTLDVKVTWPDGSAAQAHDLERGAVITLP
jgi:hypothetical protein